MFGSGLGVRQGLQEDADYLLLAFPPLSVQTFLLSSPPSSSPPLPNFSLLFPPRREGGLESEWRHCSQGQGAEATINQLKTWGGRSVWLAEPRWFCSSSGSQQVSGREEWDGHGMWQGVVAWQVWEAGAGEACVPHV